MSKIAPNNRCEILINDFISLAKEHLRTIKGQAVCTSQNVSGVIVPQVVLWTGYSCEPEQPAESVTLPPPEATQFKSDEELGIIERELLKAQTDSVYAVRYPTEVETAPIYANRQARSPVPSGTEGTRFVGSGIEARKISENYLGRTLTDAEWNNLIACTYAEAGRDSEEEAWVAGSILNRVRVGHTPLGRKNPKYQFATVTDIIWQPFQYQAVTGWKGNGFRPSRNFLNGPPRLTEVNIYGSIIKFLAQVPKDITDFTSNNDCLYVECDARRNIIYENGRPKRIEGISYDYLLNMRKKGGIVKGSSIFYY